MVFDRKSACERIPLGGIAAAVAALSCGDPADDPSLVHRWDSSGVEIVEALRPLWDSVPGWTIAPEPLVDLALSGAGPNHEFDDVTGMSRLADGSLVLVDRGWSEIRRYSAEGGFLNSTGREGEGAGEYRQIEMMGMHRATPCWYSISAAGSRYWARLGAAAHLRSSSLRATDLRSGRRHDGRAGGRAVRERQ